MKLLNQKLLLPTILLSCLSGTVSANSNPAASIQSTTEPGVTDRIIVKYRTGLSTAASSSINRISSLAFRTGTALNHVRFDASGAEILKLGNMKNINELQNIIAQIESDPDVEYAEPDAIMYPMLTPDDPRYTEQWHYYETTGGINLPSAWNTSTGSGVTVAVVDTGFRPHADLNNNIVAGYDMISDPTMARDGNGRDADARDEGDWVNAGDCGGGRPSYNQSSSWHGTHVAGTIAAVSNNNTGVAGVAFNAKIVPVRVLGRCGGYSSDISDGIIWAAGGNVSGAPANANPAKVINMSLGGLGACSATYQNAINQARSLGATVIVAAGNAGQNAYNTQPANCNGVVTVAATTRSGGRSSFSNYGSVVDIAAPGSNILSTWNNGSYAPGNDTYKSMNGTSMATPHVAGLAALLYAASPGISPDTVESTLKTTARSFPASCNQCGYGIVDATAAVAAVSSGGNQQPVAIANGPFNVSVNTNINFDGSGSHDPDGSITAYAWDFGDGAVSNLVSPAHSYATAGAYAITLTVTDNRGATSNTTTSATITDTPTNGLENGVAVNGLTANTGSFVKYYIDVPAGASDLQIAISGGSGDADLYTKHGTEPTDNSYSCRPYAGGNTENCGVTTPASGRWYINIKAFNTFSGLQLVASYNASPTNEAPIANANGPYSGVEGTAVNFSSQGSSDPDGNITGYLWDFGDGTTSTQPDPAHTYSRAGDYPVSLSVTDNKNLTTTTNTTAAISSAITNKAPIAVANGPYTSEINIPITFDSTGSNDPDGSIVSYSWNFGDGTSSNGATPAHTYTNPGNYTATLTVSDNQNVTGTASAQVTISDSGTGNALQNGVTKTGVSAATGAFAKFYIDLPANASNLNIEISGGTGDADMYVQHGTEPTDSSYTCRPYAGGNSEVCNEANPSSGRWFINLKAFSGFTNVNLLATYSTGSGNASPIAAVNGPYNSTIGSAINFDSTGSNDTDGNIVSYNWDFGDGTSSSSANPSHSYNNLGTYTVTLTVTDNQNATGTASTTANITDGNGGGLVNACNTQTPTDYVSISTGVPACVTSSNSASNMFYFYFDVAAGTSQLTIKTEHGTGNVDLYYSNSGWPTTTSYTQLSSLAGNAESITVVNPTSGWNYIMLHGAHSNVTVQMDSQ